MNPSQSSPVNESSSQPMDVYQQSTPSSPVDRQNEVEKEQEMAELLMTMDNYKAIIPDAVIDYYLNKTGFDCDDERIKKLFALAAQKFIADIATDAFQFNKVKRSTTKANKEKKIVLNMEDLSNALSEYGVNVKKPEYYE